MESNNVLARILRPIKNKIFLMLGRGIVKAINNSGDYQRLQLKLLKGETATNTPRFQEYGLETYPLSDAEALALFFNGNRDHGIVICVNDKRYRPTYLASGEVVLYSLDDSESEGHRIHFKDGQIIEVKGKEVNILSTSFSSTNTTSFDVTAPKIGLTGATTITGNLIVTGSIQSGVTGISTSGPVAATGAVSGSDFTPTAGPSYNAHKHTQANDSHGDSEADTSTPV